MGLVEVTPGVSVRQADLDRAVEMALAAKAAALVAEIAAVAEAHQDDAVGYGETAWNAEAKTVLYVAGDWTDIDPIAADFLAVDGVELVHYECEAMPTGWCEAEVVYGGDPYADACSEEASVTAALPSSRTPASADDVARHNRLLELGQRRADELEERLARILEPILYRAGLEAATAFRELATDHLTAALPAPVWIGTPGGGSLLAVPEWAAEMLGDSFRASAPGVTSRSTMICVKPRAEEAAAIADPDGEPAETLHVTLVYLGELDGDLAPIVDALRVVAATHGPLEGVVGGYGRFEPPGVGILLPDVPGLVELRVAVTEALVSRGIDYAREHGFEAHITIDSDPEPGELEQTLERAAQAPLHFDEMLVVRGDTEIVPIPLTGAAPLTASADPFLERLAAALAEPLDDPGRPARSLGLTAAGNRNPSWSAPAGDEIVDVQGIVRQLRTKTDPVRRAFVEAVMTPALKDQGIAFDVTNPLTAKAFASSGEHITSIAETTQLNVMRIVKESYDQGLSIPDTAKAIQAGMRDASFTRATMIARTELAGAVNAGSLAATQLVSEATGTGYVKRWLTAPGALHPRHETYEGLDGQTVALDGYFDVGGSTLEYPGDPSGDPGEVINCRCTMVYDTPEGEQETDADSGGPDFSEGDLGGEGGGGEDLGLGAELPTTAASAASRFMDGVAMTAQLAGEAAPDSTDLAAGVKNWTKHLKKDAVFDEESLAKVRAADDYNRSSPVFRDQTAKHGQDTVVVVKDTVAPASPLSPGRDLSAGKRMTGNRVTVLRREALDEARTGPIEPGDAGSISKGGLEAVLRHEYGHQLEEALSPTEKAAFRADLPSPETVKTDLTIYAKSGLDVGNAQEAFCELFAVVTDPAYDPAAWPEWVRDLGHKYFGAPLSRATTSPVAAAASRISQLVPGTPEWVVGEVKNYQDGFVETWARQAGVTPAEYLDQTEKILRDVVPKAEVRVRVGPATLKSVLRDGRFKSQFETGASRGMFDPAYRASQEEEMFGYPTGIPTRDRPIYGYLSGTDERGLVSSYGNLVVRLKEDVKERTTFTLGDSLNAAGFKPSPMLDPSTISASFTHDVVSTASYDKSLNGLSNGIYAEAQIHGGLEVADIAEVVIDKGAMNDQIGEVEQLVYRYRAKVHDAELTVARVRAAGGDAIYAVRELEDFRRSLSLLEARLVEATGMFADLTSALDAAGVPWREGTAASLGG